jgi:hypothetical protein
VKSNSVHRFEEGLSENPTIHAAEALDIGASQSNIARKPTALRQVPNQRLFGPKAAARYLGICEDTLKKITWSKYGRLN